MLFLPVTSILASCFFGNLLVEVQTKTGARLGEVQQIAQNPECINQLVNVGPKAETRWLLRMVPKGRKQRADYFIDNKTKDLLMELLTFHRACYQSKKLPIVPLEPQKARPDRYGLQWKERGLTQGDLNDALRFLLHGCITAADGSGIHLSSHLLRHAFATEMATLKVPIEVVAALLHQRDLSVTRYYSQPTRTQVMDAAEMIFVDRIDVAAEALRNPDEIGRMLREAEGKIGALTEVIGGTCDLKLLSGQVRLHRLRRQCARSGQALPDRTQEGMGRTAGTVGNQREIARRAAADETTAGRLRSDADGDGFNRDR
jgi:hypothetical protein